MVPGPMPLAPPRNLLRLSGWVQTEVQVCTTTTTPHQTTTLQLVAERHGETLPAGGPGPHSRQQESDQWESEQVCRQDGFFCCRTQVIGLHGVAVH